MNRTAAALALTLFVSLLAAGGLVADDRPALVLEAAGPGPVAVEAAAILEHFGARSIPVAELALSDAGRPAFFEVVGGDDGALDAGDVLLYAAGAPVGPASRRVVHVLARSSEGSRPFRRMAALEPGGGRAPAGTVVVRTVIERDAFRATFEEHLHDLRADVDRYLMLGVGATEAKGFPIELPRRPAGPVEFRIELVGEAPTGTTGGAVVRLAGRQVGEVRLGPGERRVVEATIEVEGAVRFEIESSGGARNRRVWLDRIEAVYPVEAAVASIEGLAFEAEAGVVRFEAEGAFRVWDLDGGWTTAGDRAADVPLRAGRHLVFGADRPQAPAVIRPSRAAEALDPTGADYLAIVPDEAFAAALEPLVAHRRGQGLACRVVTTAAIYDAYGGGVFSNAAIRRFLIEASRSWQPAPRFVLLAADATWEVDWFDRPVIPSWTVETYLNGETGSDNPYADLDGDHLPDLALGRLPARTAGELARLVARTIEYETGSLPGAWRRRIRFMTGEGRFGGGADQMLEQVFARMVTDRIPDGYDVHITYANPTSPYLCPPSRLNDSAIGGMNAGALFYVYVGHGFAEGFDSLRWGRERYPILTTEHLDRIDVVEGMPIVLVLACTTGRYDHPRIESIGEGLIRRPRGPVAFIGASRISHPYPMGVLSKEMIDILFHEGRPGTLGEILRDMKRRSLPVPEGDPLRRFIDFSAGMFLRDGPPLERLRADHLYLFNLLGDPALRVGLAGHGVDLVAPGRARPGDEVEVAGLVSGLVDGRLVVSLEAMRDRILEPLEPVEPGRPGFEDRIARNYARANDRVVVAVDGGLEANPFLVRLTVPADLAPGTYRIKAFADGPGGAALGARRIRIEE